MRCTLCSTELPTYISFSFLNFISIFLNNISRNIFVLREIEHFVVQNMWRHGDILLLMRTKQRSDEECTSPPHALSRHVGTSDSV
jgi:hypothetical protein